MTDKLRTPAFILLSVLLLVSVTRGFLRPEPVGWFEVILVVAVIFVAVGGRIKTLAISPKSLTVEQEVEKLSREMEKVDRFVEEDRPTNDVMDIVADPEHPRDIWTRLLFIRMTLRRLLRKVAAGHGLSYSPAVSISRMISDLLRQGIIDAVLAAEAEKMRNATFVVEWGAGSPPDPADIRFSLENYAKVFDALKRRVSS